MHRLRTLLLLVVITALGSCSEVPENNDPVIGIWGQTQAPKDASAKHMERVEWIFNDAYLGRYHRYMGNEIIEQTDFKKFCRPTFNGNNTGAYTPSTTRA